jgi:hypothetical protein
MRFIKHFLLRLAITVFVLAVPLSAGTGAPFAGQMVQGISDPRSITGLEAWYDVSDLSSIVKDGSNRVQLLADKSGNSAVNVLALNGVAGNYASFTALTAFGTGDFSVSASASVASLAAANALFGAAENGFAFRVDVTTGLLRSSKSNIAANNPSSSGVSVFTEAVLGYVRSGTTGTYYINGVSVGSVTDSQDYTVGITNLGATLTGTSFPLNGTIKWARVYSTALTAPEMLADAQGTVQANCTFNQDFSGNAKLATSVTATTGQTVTINTTGRYGARICGARDLVNMTAAEQPTYLAYSGENYGWLNGVSGNYFSSPDSAALDITGDIDLRAYVRLLDWTPSAGMALIMKSNSDITISYRFTLNSNGTLFIRCSSDGASNVGQGATSSASVPFSDGDAGWVRATRASATGEVLFYTSTDGATWTQLGTSQSTNVYSIFNSTSSVEIGSRALGTADLFSGQYLRAQIYNGINGTLAFDFNPAAYTSGTTFLDSSSNAATITLNGGSVIVNRTQLYFDGSNDSLKAAAFALAQPEWVNFVGSQVSWTLNDCFYDGDGVSNRMGLFQAATTPAVRPFAGTTDVAADNSGLAIARRGLISVTFNAASSGSRINNGTSVPGSIGANSGNGFVVGARYDGAQPSNITVNEIGIYGIAPTIAQQDAWALYAGRKWGFSL